jgi:hypothetical protein
MQALNEVYLYLTYTKSCFRDLNGAESKLAGAKKL